MQIVYGSTKFREENITAGNLRYVITKEWVVLISVGTLKMIHTENVFKLWAYSYSILHQFCISANKCKSPGDFSNYERICCSWYSIISGSIEALLVYFYIYFLIKFSFIEKEIPPVKIYFPGAVQKYTRKHQES